MHESCGQCTPCREGTGWLWRDGRAHRARPGPPRDLDLLNNGGRQHPGPHHLRAGRRRGDAGAGMIKALPRRVRPPHRAQDPHGPVPYAWRASRDEHDRNRTRRQEGQVAEGSMVMHAPRRQAPSSPLLLPQEALDRGQLPHVPGRRGEGAQADAGLRHAGHAGHDRAHQERQGGQGAAVGDGVPAHQPPAGLPDLRPGRRMPAAGPLAVGYGGSALALPGREARRLPQERRAR